MHHWDILDHSIEQSTWKKKMIQVIKSIELWLWFMLPTVQLHWKMSTRSTTQATGRWDQDHRVHRRWWRREVGYFLTFIKRKFVLHFYGTLLMTFYSVWSGFKVGNNLVYCKSSEWFGAFNAQHYYYFDFCLHNKDSEGQKPNLKSFFGMVLFWILRLETLTKSTFKTHYY